MCVGLMTKSDRYGDRFLTPPRNPAYSQKSTPLFPHPPPPCHTPPHSRCRMDRERFEPGGRECPGPGVLTWRARLREAEAIGVPLAASVRGGASPEGQVPEDAGGKPATGPGSFPRPPEKGGRGAGHRAGPVADMAGRKRPARVRAGTRAKSISRGLSGSRPEQSGRRALKRGRWISQPSRHAGRRLSDAGQHPASSGPRALSATQYQSYLRHCLRAALRTEFRAEPGGHVARAVSGCPESQAGAEKGPVSPRAAAHCRRAINFGVAGGTFAERLSCPRLRHRRGAA
jgi:hypothetical protein